MTDLHLSGFRIPFRLEIIDDFTSEREETKHRDQRRKHGLIMTDHVSLEHLDVELNSCSVTLISVDIFV